MCRTATVPRITTGPLSVVAGGRGSGPTSVFRPAIGGSADQVICAPMGALRRSATPGHSVPVPESAKPQRVLGRQRGVRIASALLLATAALLAGCSSGGQDTAYESPLVSTTQSSPSGASGNVDTSLDTLPPTEAVGRSCTYTDPAMRPISVARALTCPDSTQVWAPPSADGVMKQRKSPPSTAFDQNPSHLQPKGGCG